MFPLLLSLLYKSHRHWKFTVNFIVVSLIVSVRERTCALMSNVNEIENHQTLPSEYELSIRISTKRSCDIAFMKMKVI